jgi:hypothetical protein
VQTIIPITVKLEFQIGFFVVSGVNDTADLWWAALMTPLTGGGGVNDTVDQWWTVSMIPLTKYATADQWASKFNMLLLLLTGISKKIIHRQIVLHYICNIHSTEDHFCGHTADRQKSRFHNRISQIRSHMQKGFNPWARGPDRVV